MQIVLGRYFTMKLCTRIRTHMTQPDSSTRMGRSTPPSRPRRPGFLVQAEGMNFHALRSIANTLPQDLSRALFRSPDVASHHRAYSCHVRHPPSGRRCWTSEDPRSQVLQAHASVSLQLRRWNKIYKESRPRNTMPFECVVKPRSEKAIKLIYDAVTVHR